MADADDNVPAPAGEEEIPQTEVSAVEEPNVTESAPEAVPENVDGDELPPPGSKVGSAHGSRAGSAQGSRAGSVQGSRAGSAQGSRAGSKAGSAKVSPTGSVQGSRPASGKQSPAAMSARVSPAASPKPASPPAAQEEEPEQESEEMFAAEAEAVEEESRSDDQIRRSKNEEEFLELEEIRQKEILDMKKKPKQQRTTNDDIAVLKRQRSSSLDKPKGYIKFQSEDGKALNRTAIKRHSFSVADDAIPVGIKGSKSYMNVSKLNLIDDVTTHKTTTDGGSSSTEISLPPIGLKSSRSHMNVSRFNLIDNGEHNFPSTIHSRGSGIDLSNDNMQAQRWASSGPPDGGDDDYYGGGGGDDDDEEDDEEYDDGQAMEESDDNSDAETDMVVLDPDHPLMKRFQAALNSHLTKQDDKISLELRDLDETLRVKKKVREDLGVELYGVQQELARYQMILEQKHDTVAGLKQERQKEEQELVEVRSLYKDGQLVVNKEKKKGSELQSEVENLALRLFYMDNAKEDVRSDISVMRRAAEKVESEVSRAELEKQKQDLYVDRLVEGVDKLKEEIAMYEAQISAQSEETKTAKESLMEAYMEIEAINLEKKDLYQKWNSSLIGMRRRDEAHSAMQEALDQQEQHILSLYTEIEGFKKSIQKEQEQNEKLTLILNKTEREIEVAKKHIIQVQAKHDALKAEYTTYTRMLHETEQTLARATADKVLRENECLALRKQIEQEFQAKLKLEDSILEKMRSQLTMDKAAKYSKKLTGKTRERTKHMETDAAEVENLIAEAVLETVNVRTRVDRLKKVLGELDFQVEAQNNIISKSEMEIVKRNATIERKQNQVDIMNKKLNQMIDSAGGVELGPLEIQINSLQKSIESRNQEIMELQQQWLRQQTELVRLSQTKEKEIGDLTNCKRQLTILSQKKIRTENDIDQQHREMCDIERNVRNMRNDIIKLNTLLHKEKNMGKELEEGNVLMENAFISNLKDSELQSIELQNKLDGIKDEKERLLNSLVEAERQIMLWEKKTQLARETRAAVDSEVGQGEMRAMKSEIHRMQVRYSQLMKQQEIMIQDMEKTVSRRDTILTRGDAQSKMKKKVLTKGTFERQMQELRKKIKSTIQDANSCDGEIRDLRDHQHNLSGSLEEKQINCQQLQMSSDTLDGDVDRTAELKAKNLVELLARQQKMKYYQQVKDGKYTMMCKTPASLDLETQKQEDRVQALNAIIDRLNSEFPHAQSSLRKATVLLGSRSSPSEQEPQPS